VLLDSNAWVSGFATRGLCADLVRAALKLHGRGHFELLICPAVRDETLRILADKFKVLESDLDAVRATLSWAQMVPDHEWAAAEDFPDPDDIVIVGAAMRASADLFVTGDRALLALERVASVALTSPRSAYELMLGLSSSC
jgi:predicted nucleic acid-binding protein